MIRWKISFAAAMLLGLQLFGSGFGSFEQGPQGHGNAGAFVARAEDGSALYYNPAGLAQLRFSELYLGAKPSYSKSFYSNPGQSSWGSDPIFETAPDFYFNLPIGWFALGLGTATTYDYELDWAHEDFPARFSFSDSMFRVREAMAGIAFRLGRRLSLGFTYRAAQLDYRLSGVLPRPLDPANPALFYEARERYTADGDSDGFIAGIQYRHSRKLNIGVSFTSAVDLDLEGFRRYELLTRVNDVRAQDSFNRSFANTSMSTTASLPERWLAGFSLRTSVRTRVEADFSLEQWSTYEATVIDTFDRDGNPEQVVIPRRWDDSFSVRLSGDFQQRKALLWRMGIASVKRMVPDDTVGPDFPDHDRFIYALGVSYHLGTRYYLEAGWAFTQYRDRNVSGQELVFDNQPPDYTNQVGQNGLYETQRHQINLGLRIRFGKLEP